MIKRVEILFPILSPMIKKRILAILELELRDTVKSRVQDSNGMYVYKKSETKVHAQQQFMEYAKKGWRLD